ncbi:hypothetical protein BGZ91_011215 [Linnemannia elongata]|nr:hypothetical protein BGZ91_011215 [Linnemannia elongata]
MTTKHKLGPYKSNEYQGAYIGTCGLFKLSDVKRLDERYGIVWTKERQRIRALRFHMGPVITGDTRTADESNYLGNMITGILGCDQQLVKYSNPCLLEYLLPNLYPKGRGFFSKDYSGIEGDQNRRIQYYDGRFYTQSKTEKGFCPTSTQ